MARSDLQSVFEWLIKEDAESASSLLKKWMNERCSEFHEAFHQEAEKTDENLSPISGINTADDDVDAIIITPDDRDETDDVQPGDIDLEDRVESVEAELAQLRAEVMSLLSDDEVEPKPNIERGDDIVDFDFEGLEESFQLKESEKVSKASVEYSEGMKSSHCGICANFIKPDGCKKVSGDIDADYWCKLFKKQK